MIRNDSLCHIALQLVNCVRMGISHVRGAYAMAIMVDNEARNKPEPIRMDDRGRILLPKSVRDALGLESGDTLFILMTGPGRLEVRKAINPFDRALEMASHDDEPYTDEERAAVSAAREDVAAGRTVSHEEMRRLLLNDE